MCHPIDDQTPTAFVIPVPENLLPGMAGRTILLKRRLLLACPRNIPQQLRPAQLPFNLRRRRQIVRSGNSLQHDVVELRSSVYLHGISKVRLEFPRGGNPQSVVPSLHLGKFKASLFICIHRRSDAVRRDELYSDAFRRVSARDPHNSRGAT